jgi:hypothetical protein
MTVLNERELGISGIQEATEPLAVAVAAPKRKKAAADEGFIDDEPAAEAEAEAEAPADLAEAEPVAAAEEAPKPKRAPRKKTEKKDS